MQITLFPMRRDDRPEIVRTGDTLTVDGQDFDFSPLTEGAVLPSEAVGSEWIIGTVSRQAGVVNVAIILAHGANAPQETRFPEPIVLTEDGPVLLPPFNAEEPSE